MDESLYEDIRKMISEFEDIRKIKNNSMKKYHLTREEWMILNDMFNRFVNQRYKPFRKIKDSYMIL
ncbi:MAG: hypothetical protein ACUVWJ_01840 [Spirochaetota bacterium]